jgi:hypothetical protein
MAKFVVADGKHLMTPAKGDQDAVYARKGDVVELAESVARKFPNKFTRFVEPVEVEEEDPKAAEARKAEEAKQALEAERAKQAAEKLAAKPQTPATK